MDFKFILSPPRFPALVRGGILFHAFYVQNSSNFKIQYYKMPGISLANTVAHLSLDDEWGPEITTATTLDGIPYAPYSKGDKLGRMADWTQEGKEGRDRGQRYGRGFRGSLTMHKSLRKHQLTL